MKITINDIAILDTKHCTLYLKDSREIFVELSETATFLFKILLLRNKEVILRDDLLKTVWEDRGYRTSNSSLNNNVHAIRKSYSDITGDGLQLRTIPKVGFEMFCNSVSIDESVVELYEHAVEGVSKKRIRRLAYLFSFLIVFLFSALIYYLITPSNYIKDKDNPLLLSQVSQCSLYLLNTYNYDKNSSTDISEFKKNLNEKECSDRKIDFFYEKDVMNPKNLFYVRCEKSASGYSECSTTKNVFIDN